MSKEEFLAKLESLFQIGSIESYNKSIELVDQEIKARNTGIGKKDLELIKLNANISITRLEVEQIDPNDYKQQMHLRGRLINLLKQAEKHSKDSKMKMKFRYEGLQEIKKQKEVIQKRKHCKDTKISISENVALSVKDIAKSIEIFLKEKDVLYKAGNVIKGTATSVGSVSLILAGISFAIQKFTGLPISLFSLSSIMPLVAYSGLSGIIAILSSKTPFEQYIYHQSDEYKELVNSFMEEHNEQIQEIAKLVQEKESAKYNEDKIAINEQLIEKLDELIASTNIQGIMDTFGLQALGYFRENKEFCEKIRDEYLDEINNDREKYKEYNSKLMHINLEIFKRENSIKDAIKSSGKGVINSMKVVLIAKLIMSQVAPAVFPLNGLDSFKLPFAFAVINGLIDIPTYKNKLKFKETEYQGKITAENKERIEEILEMKKMEPVMA